MTFFRQKKEVAVYQMTVSKRRLVEVKNWIELARLLKRGDCVDIDKRGGLYGAGMRLGYTMTTRKHAEGGYTLQRVR